jgi:F0F1-type ATP synthase membrane subunit b/b'
MDLNVNFSVIYIICCFLLIWTVAKKTVFAKLDEILSARHEKIEGAKAEAFDNDEKIAKKMAAVNASVAEARGEAFGTRQATRNEALLEQKDIVEAARQAASDKVSQAQAELTSAIEEAKVKLQADTDEIAREISDNLLGRTA